MKKFQAILLIYGSILAQWASNNPFKVFVLVCLMVLFILILCR